MKKGHLIAAFAALFIVSTASISTGINTVRADSTTENSDVPGDVQSAVDDLMTNHTKDNAEISDASFSEDVLRVTLGKSFAWYDFDKIPIVKKDILKNVDDQYSSQQFPNVQFRYGVSVDYYTHPVSILDISQNFDIFRQGNPKTVFIQALYNGKVIGAKSLPISFNYPNGSVYSSPTDATGVVTSRYAQVTPLHDTENDHSSRGVASNTKWATDKFMINYGTAEMFYRVSTSEWLNYATFSSSGNSGLRLSDKIGPNKDLPTYRVSFRETTGEPLYKANGDLWYYTLPNNTDWKITAISFDQFGVPYFQVSDNAWVRSNG
jgi:hypothetical protein